MGTLAQPRGCHRMPVHMVGIPRPPVDHPPGARPHDRQPGAMTILFRKLSIWCGPGPPCPPSGQGMELSETTPTHSHSHPSHGWLRSRSAGSGGRVCRRPATSTLRVARSRPLWVCLFCQPSDHTFSFLKKIYILHS